MSERPLTKKIDIEIHNIFPADYTPSNNFSPQSVYINLSNEYTTKGETIVDLEKEGYRLSIK